MISHSHIRITTPRVSGIKNFEGSTHAIISSLTIIEKSMAPIPQPKQKRCIVLEVFIISILLSNSSLTELQSFVKKMQKNKKIKCTVKRI